jgi:hypothetical protein
MEVMIAMAILSIGLLAILALFPIGAVNMARAINQNRAAEHATNSDALFRYYWKQAWLDPNGGGIRPTDQAIAASGEPMLLWLDRSPVNPALPLIPATSSQPSFPVLVDPIGFRTQAGASQNFVCGVTTMPVRANLAATPFPTPDSYQARATIRNTTMLDEFSYDGNGEPSALTGQLDRGGRYNVAWLIQRPKNNVQHEVHLQVLVFAGRSPTDSPAVEQNFPAVATDYYRDVDPKPKSLTIAVNGQQPALLKGKWLAFTVTIQPQLPPPQGTGVAYPAFDFYRISAVEVVDDNTVVVELEQPLRSYDPATFAPGTYNPANGALLGQVVVFDSLFEVFDRGVVSASAISGR